VAAILVEEGFSTVDEIAYVPLPEMMAIHDLDEEIVTLLRDRAKDVLLTRAIASEESLDQEPAEDLLQMNGMDEVLAFSLARNGVVTMEDLAERSVDELREMTGIDAERAAALIMKAREPWFAEAQNE
jgi:N utilization substance protein A